MTTHDMQDRAYARLSDLKPGDLVQVDSHFVCMAPWLHRKVFRSTSGTLCIECTEGAHGLDRQLDADGETLIGIYPADVVRR